MYAKIFSSLWEGSLRGRSDEILVFINLLTHCSPEGFVDRHFRAISDETGLPLDRVKAAIKTLEEKDDESRSPDMEGRRLERIDAHREWGWRIVNFQHYRDLNSQIKVQEQNKLRQQRFRDKNQSEAQPPVPVPSLSKQIQIQNKIQIQELTVCNASNGDNVTQVTYDYEIPLVLRTKEFLETWADWLADRKARKMPVTVYAAKLQLRKLSKLGEKVAIQWIECAIEKGWRGLYEPPATLGQQKTQRPDRSIGTTNEGIGKQYHGIGRVKHDQNL